MSLTPAAGQRAQVYDDVPKALAQWVTSGVKVYVYSSGSRQAQRLIFGARLRPAAVPLRPVSATPRRGAVCVEMARPVRHCSPPLIRGSCLSRRRISVVSGKSNKGDLRPFFSGFFDAAGMGSKLEAGSYRNIAESCVSKQSAAKTRPCLVLPNRLSVTLEW